MRKTIGILLLALLCGCSAIRYVPVESVRTEYRDRDVERLVNDTVRDTRIIWIKGDTVVDIREKEHVRLAEIHDTCYIEHIDSIRVPYPVERKLTRWEQTKIDLGGMALAGFAIAVVFLMVRIVIRKP